MLRQQKSDFLLTISKCLKNAIFDKITDRYLTGLEAHLTDNDEQYQNPDMKRVHVRTSQRMFPSEVKHCIQTNWADHRVQMFGTWLSLIWKNWEVRVYVSRCVDRHQSFQPHLNPARKQFHFHIWRISEGNRICNEKIVCTKILHYMNLIIHRIIKCIQEKCMQNTIRVFS